MSTAPMTTARRVGLTAGITGGALFAVFATTALVVLVDSPLPAATVSGLLGGVFFGIPMGLLFAKRHRGLLEGLEATDAGQVRAAHRLLRHPTQDADPATRRLAARLARHQLQQLESARPRLALIFAGLAIAYATAALLSSPWWWAAAALFTSFWFMTLQQRRSLRRRLGRLDDGPVPGGTDAGAR